MSKPLPYAAAARRAAQAPKQLPSQGKTSQEQKGTTSSASRKKGASGNGSASSEARNGARTTILKPNHKNPPASDSSSKKKKSGQNVGPPPKKAKSKQKPSLQSMSIGDLIPKSNAIMKAERKQASSRGLHQQAANTQRQPSRIHSQHPQSIPTPVQTQSENDFPPLSFALAARGTANPSQRQQQQQPRYVPSNNRSSGKKSDKSKLVVAPKTAPPSKPPPSQSNKKTTMSTNPKSVRNPQMLSKKPPPRGVSYPSLLAKPTNTSATMDDPHLQAQLPFARHAMAGDEHALFNFVQGVNQGEPKKGRQRVKPRKKKFSVLKRRILQERLEKWKALHPEQFPDGKQQQPTLDGSQQQQQLASHTICVHGFVRLDELEDDDEYEELKENLLEMAEKVGGVRSVFIPRHVDVASDNDRCPVFVSFENARDADAAKACWDGLVLGGQSLEINVVSIVETEEFDCEQWEKACVEAKSTDDVEMVDAAASTSYKVELPNILTDDDLEDEDCFEESVNDIRSIVEQFGSVKDLQTRVGNDGRSIHVVYEGGLDATKVALEQLQRVTLGGSSLSPSLLEEKPSGSAGQTDLQRSSIRFQNVLSEDDLEDEECLEESMQDIQELAAQHGKVLTIARENEDDVVVCYEGGPEVATNAASMLSSVVFGGQQLKVSVVVASDKSVESNESQIVTLRNLLTEDDLEDEECLDESLGDVRMLAEQHGTVLDVQVIKEEGGIVLLNYSSRKEAQAAADGFNGMVIGGVEVEAILSNQNVDSAETDVADAIVSPENPTSAGDSVPTTNAPSTTEPKEPEIMMSGDKRIPERFAECKRVPKIPNKGVPRSYATLLGDESIKPILVEMLSELMRLQARAVKDNNAKARRRIVAGLREVARGIRANKVKMVVMANNLDDYGALDTKLQEILDLAADKELPVLFELSKRLLGKAVGKKIKVSVVGIQSTDGAHQQYAKLAAIAPRISRPDKVE